MPRCLRQHDRRGVGSQPRPGDGANELRELAAGFGKLLQPYLDRPATPDRTRRVIRTIVLPGDDPPEASLSTRQRNGGRADADE
jgi:hypothetical protein